MYLAIVSIYGLVMVKECPTLDDAKAWAREKIQHHGTRHYPHAEFIPSFYRVERITSSEPDEPDNEHEM